MRSALFIPTDPISPLITILIQNSCIYHQINALTSVTELLFSCARPQEIITKLLCPRSRHIYLSTRPRSRPFVMKSSPCPGVTRSLFVPHLSHPFPESRRNSEPGPYGTATPLTGTVDSRNRNMGYRPT